MEQQARLRITIALLWVAFWVITSIAVLLAPWLRQDRRIGAEQIIPALVHTSGIWLPALSCFAGFWFPMKELVKSRRRMVTKERYMAAISLTVLYLTCVLVVVLWPVYVLPYDYRSAQIPPGGSFLEEIAKSVSLALLASPIALAPINWLTGGTTND